MCMNLRRRRGRSQEAGGGKDTNSLIYLLLVARLWVSTQPVAMTTARRCGSFAKAARGVSCRSGTRRASEDQ